MAQTHEPPSETTSDHTEAEAALRESEERFRATFEQAAVGIAHVSSEKRYLRINQKFCDIVGYTRDEMLARTFEEITHPDDLDSDRADVHRLLAGEIDNYSKEKRYLHKNGEIIWVNITVTMLRKESGQPRWAVAVVQDITRRKQAEEALRNSNSQLQHAQRIGKMGSLALDLKTNQMQWSDEVYRMLRIDRGKVSAPIIESILDLVHPDDLALVEAKLEAAVIGTADFKFDCRMVCSDGTEIWTATEAKLIRDHDGAPISLRGMIQDITERKTLEEALGRSEERYRGLSEAAFEAIFLSEKGVCLEQNAAAEKMFGYTSAEAIGRKGTEWIAAEDREMVMDNMLSGREEPYEATALRKDGSTFPVEIQARMTQYEGRTVRVTALTDITQRKRAEDALLESEEKFKTLVTKNEEIVYMIAKDGTFLLSEGKGLSKLGLNPGDVVGKSVFELYEDYPQMLDSMRRAFDGETVTTEINVAGEYFRNWYTPYKNHQDEIIGLLGLSVNTTERVKTELMLKKSDDHLRRAQEIANSGSWELDLTNGDLFWSDEVYRIFGIPGPQPLTFETFLGSVPSEDRDHVERSWQAALRGEPYDIEHRIIVDGEVKWVREKAQVEFDGEGRPVSGTGTVQDITARRISEKKLHDYQLRLRALAAELTLSEERERRRIAVDLHDNVAQSLSMARVQIVSAKKAAVDTDLVARLDEVSQSLLQAIHETRDIMYDLSSPSMNEIGLDAAISEWMENRIASRHGLKTEFTANELKTSLTTDVRAILFRNVRELLTNVVKHARAEEVSVRMEVERDTLRIVVEDDGVGFDAHDHAHAESHEGGFGLFSIRESMAGLGGSLEIESEPGLGCAAALVIPRPR